MPIRIPDNLPAYQTLLNENIFVMRNDRAEHQDIRPLRVAILNLMPTKIETETQFLRLLSNTPLHVDIELIHMGSHISKTTSASHLLKFYKTYDDVKDEKFDGLIITGAPVEMLPFEDVDYWEELCKVFEWSKSNIYSTIHVCWGAQAGLYYHYGIKKHLLDEKMFGIFPHKILVPNHPLLKGFGDTFLVPHSRHTEVRREDIEADQRLEILTESDISGVHIVSNKTDRQFFITGHSEYDRDTIAKEYFRDKGKGLPIHIPYNYFPDDDDKKIPVFNWCCYANLMFSNWLNYCVYQQTPFNLDELEPIK